MFEIKHHSCEKQMNLHVLAYGICISYKIICIFSYKFLFFILHIAEIIDYMHVGHIQTAWDPIVLGAVHVHAYERVLPVRMLSTEMPALK